MSEQSSFEERHARATEVFETALLAHDFPLDAAVIGVRHLGPSLGPRDGPGDGVLRR